jgi:hypothetical protein
MNHLSVIEVGQRCCKHNRKFAGNSCCNNHGAATV